MESTDNGSQLSNPVTNKSVHVKTCFRKRLQNKPTSTSNFKRVVIDDASEDDEIVDSCQDKENQDVHRQLKETLATCIGQQIMKKDYQLEEHAIGRPSLLEEKMDENEVCQGKKNVESFKCEVNSIPLVMFDGTSLENITIEDSILENLIDQQFKVGKTDGAEKIIEDLITQEEVVIREEDNSNCVVDDGDNADDDIIDNLAELILSENSTLEKMEALNEDSDAKDMTDDIECRKLETLGDNGDSNCNEEQHENIEDVNNNRTSSQRICSNNMGMKNGIDIFCSQNDMVENDVITEVFTAGGKQRAWQLMKRKQHSAQHKKVIYPVIIKDLNRRKENISNGDIHEPQSSDNIVPVVSPLLQFQNSLKTQIAELVSTIRSLHAVEKDAIIDTLASQQQTVNKETLDALQQILSEKNPSPSDQKSCNRCGTLDGRKGINDKSVNNCKHPHKSLPTDRAKIVACDTPEVATEARTDNNTKISNGVMAAIKPVSKKKGPKKIVAPHLSVLKTPVRRKKAPSPFSKKSEVEIPVPSNKNPPSCALLQEILRDTSSTKEKSLEGNNMTLGHAGCPEQEMFVKCDPLSGIQESREAAAMAKSCVQLREERSPVLEQIDIQTQANLKTKHSMVGNASDVPYINNTTEGERKNSTIESKSETMSENFVSDNKGCEANILQPIYYTHRTRNRQYNFPKKLSLDERINRLRQEFINSDNEWLYESKTISPISDTTLENAKKVLKEVEVTSKTLANDYFMKYKDQDEVMAYFEANPYLIDSEVVRIKKNVDENIRKMKPKRMTGKKETGKYNRKPLKEINEKRR